MGSTRKTRVVGQPQMAPGDQMVSSDNHFRRIIDETLNEANGAHTYTAKTIGPEALLGTTELKGPDGAQVLGHRGDYFLRVASHPYGLEGIIGKVSVRHCRGMIRNFVLSAIERINMSFPGHWRPVAHRIEYMQKPVMKRVETGAHGTAQKREVDPHDTEPRAEHRSPQRTEHAKFWQDYLVLVVVLTDISQSPPRDPLSSAMPSNATGSLYAWGQTGFLHQLSASLRAERDRAELVIRDAFGEDGDMHNPTSFRADDLRKIRSLDKALTVEQIAAAFDTDVGTIKRILSDKPKGKPKEATP